MDADFWRSRWANREIGFHRSDIHWALTEHWNRTFSGTADSEAEKTPQVLVPLSGKALDLRWLADHSRGITGIELDERAVREFFDEWGHEPEIDGPDHLRYYRAGNIELVCGDFFRWYPDRGYSRFYDRAALVALPADMRRDYLAHLHACLAPEAEGLLVLFEYDPDAMGGPPFSVPAREVTDSGLFALERLERRSVLEENPGLAARGLETLHESVYRMLRLPG